MKAIILVGGEGTRLRPLTLSYPKAVLPIVGKPLLARIFDWLRMYGVKQTVLTLCYKPSILQRVFGTGGSAGMKIQYVHEKRALGTAGGLKNAERFVKDTTVVLNGDVLTDINLHEIIKLHRQRKALITITLVPVEDPTAYGLVETAKDGRVLRFIEKPGFDEIGKENFINAGIYIIEPEIFKYIPAGVNSSLERDVFPCLVSQDIPFYAYKVHKSYWIDVGTPRHYRQVQHDILSKIFKTQIPGHSIEKSVWLGDSTKLPSDIKLERGIWIGSRCRLSHHVSIGESTYIGNKVTIEDGASISHAIVLDGAHIGRNAKLNDCVISFNARINDYVQVGNNAIIGEGSTVSPYSRV